MPEIVRQRLIHPVARLPLIRQPQRVQERRADHNIRDFANLAGLTQRLEDFGVLLMIRLRLATDERFCRCDACRYCPRCRMRRWQCQHQRKRQYGDDSGGMARQVRKRRVDFSCRCGCSAASRSRGMSSKAAASHTHSSRCRFAAPALHSPLQKATASLRRKDGIRQRAFQQRKAEFQPALPDESHISRAKSAMAIPCGQPNQPDTRTHARSKE